MSGLIKRIFKEENLNSLLIIGVFLFFTGWWAVIYFGFGGKDTQANDLWSNHLQVLIILGSYIGFFICREFTFKSDLLLPRRLMKFFTIGLFLSTLGSLVYTFYTAILHIDTPYPSWGDIGYFGGALSYLIGSVFFYIEVIDKNDLRKAIKTSVICLIVLTIYQVWFLQNIGSVLNWSTFSVVDTSYTVVETAFTALALGALITTRCFVNKKFRFGYILMVLGLVYLFVMDNYYSYVVQTTGAWPEGGLGDYLYFGMYYVTSLGLVQFTESFIAINILVVLFNSFFLVQFLLSGSANKFFSNGIILAVCLFTSYFLLRRNKNEVAQKERLARLDVLEESHRQLQELDKQKTEFLNIAAHQLRTPVSIIRNYIAMMQDGDFGVVPVELAEVHSHIYQSNQWLVHLADEFLNIAHLESGQTKYHFEPGDLRLAIRDVVQELRPKAEQKGLALNVAEMPNSLPAQFDEEKMKHAILNFIENAIKYTPAGSVTVSARSIDGGIEVVVRDTGMGFSAADQQGFFQKFQRGKNAHLIEVNTSTGLGLYIARKFVEGHGGKVWAKSEGLNQGSEFGFYIPSQATKKAAT